MQVRGKGGRPRKHYSQGVRLQLVREMLEANHQVRVADVAERFGTSRRTVYRDLRALQECGMPLYAEGGVDGRAIWYLHPTARGRTFTLTTAQLVALFFGRAAFRFLEGTIVHQQLEEVFSRLRAGLKQRDYDILGDLDRKLYVVGEAAKDYRQKDDVINDVLSGLLMNRCVRISYKPPRGALRDHIIEPYTLLMHRYALYVIGKSRTRGEMRTFAVERIHRSRWLREKSFDYPKSFSPASYIDGAFGVLTGKPETIEILFDAEHAPYVLERRWHPSQRSEKLAGGGARVKLRVSPNHELVSWVLGFGAGAEVIRPKSLRNRLSQEAEALVTTYRTCDRM